MLGGSVCWRTTTGSFAGSSTGSGASRSRSSVMGFWRRSMGRRALFGALSRSATRSESSGSRFARGSHRRDRGPPGRHRRPRRAYRRASLGARWNRRDPRLEHHQGPRRRFRLGVRRAWQPCSEGRAWRVAAVRRTYLGPRDDCSDCAAGRDSRCGVSADPKSGYESGGVPAAAANNGRFRHDDRWYDDDQRPS